MLAVSASFFEKYNGYFYSLPLIAKLQVPPVVVTLSCVLLFLLFALDMLPSNVFSGARIDVD